MTRIPHDERADITPLSNCKDTGEEPSSLHNSKHTTHPRNTGTTHITTVTSLHTFSNTVAKGCNQRATTKWLPLLTIAVAHDMTKTFYTINIHTLIRKLLQTNIPGTIIKLIENYIKGCKVYTTYIFKTDIPQGDVLSPTLFTIYTSDFNPEHHHIYTHKHTCSQEIYKPIPI